jgi:hypothetical protein
MRVILSVPDIPGTDRQPELDQLKQDGWKAVDLGRREPTLTHPDLRDRKEARERLRRLGLYPGLFRIEEHADGP